MSTEPSDRSLAEQLRAGQRDALAALYDRHAATMYALALRILRDEREAQDLLHDVFLEAWEHAREYDATRGSVRTWLLIRVRSRALDRKHSPRLSRRAPALEEESSPAPETSHSERIAVRGALDELPEAVRQVLELSYFAGMTAAEIALRVGVPEGTIRSRLARGLTLLEKSLRPPGESNHD